MKSNLLTGLICLSVLCIFSCKKENLPGKNASTSSVLKSIAENDMPATYQDMLYFTDQDQFSRYVSGLITIVNDSTDTTAYDVRLDQVEAASNFLSLRKTINNQISAENVIGWDNISDYPTHFIKSSSFRSVLNPFGDVRIGDDIIHYISQDYAATIDFQKQDVLQNLRNLTTTATIEDILTSSPNPLDFEISYESRPVLFTNLKKTTSIGIHPGTITIPDRCHASKTVEINDLFWQDNADIDAPHAKGNLQFVINWGDNGPNTVIYTTSYLPFHSNAIYELQHPYAHAGTYNITVTANGGAPPISGSYTYQIVVAQSCLKATRTTEDIEYIGQGQYYRIKKESWVTEGQDSHLRNRSFQGARATGFSLSGSKWKEWKPAGLSTHFDVNKYDDNCIGNGILQETTTVTNQVKAEAEDYQNDYYNWNQLNSFFHVTSAVGSPIFYQTLYACP